MIHHGIIVVQGRWDTSVDAFPAWRAGGPRGGGLLHVLLWAVRKLSDNLSPVRVAARNVEYGMNLDRQSAVEMLSQASGDEIDVALPALIKLQASAGAG